MSQERLAVEEDSVSEEEEVTPQQQFYEHAMGGEDFSDKHEWPLERLKTETGLTYSEKKIAILEYHRSKQFLSH